jgi:phosphoribosylanthranilate isomerase
MCEEGAYRAKEQEGCGNGEMSSKIKICGLSRQQDIEYANRVHPDYIGFVFYEKSRRRIDRAKAVELKKNLLPEILAVGVFVDAPCEEIIGLLEDGVIDIAQLHGEESEEDIRYIQAVTHKPVIKAVKVRDRYDVEAWLDSAADDLLFDSGMGSGVAFDWSLMDGVERDFFLAGGLHEGNLAQALERLAPYAVDLSSGVETEGTKDFEKMRAVTDLVRGSRI